MDDAVRQILKRLVAEKGKVIMLDPRRCEGLLRDYCPSSKREIGALLRSLKRQYPQRLITAGSASQVRLIAQEISDSDADWAARSWAFALGFPAEVKPAYVAELKPPLTITPPVKAPAAPSPNRARLVFLVAAIFFGLWFMASPSIWRAGAAILFFVLAFTRLGGDIGAGAAAFIRGSRDGSQK